MTFLLGDMWTNPSPANGANQIFHTMEAYIRLLHASEKPLIFVRGNHETIGGFAKYMAYLFEFPVWTPAQASSTSSGSSPCSRGQFGSWRWTAEMTSPSDSRSSSRFASGRRNG